MTRSTRVPLVVVFALLGGCISTGPFDVYMPQGDGELVKSLCPSGPPHVLRIALPDQVQLLIEAAPADIYPTPYLQVGLYVRLLAPAGTTVRFTGAEVVLTSKAWPALRQATIGQIIDRDMPAVRFPPLAELPGTQRTPRYLGYQLLFANNGPGSATSIPAVDSFTLQLPTIVVNGRESPLAKITFAQETIRGAHLACD